MVARRPKFAVLIALTLLGAATIVPSTVGAAPVEMSLIGALAGGVPHDVVIDDDYAYVAAQGALSILDISSPANPVQVGFLDTPGSAEGVAVSGDYAYVADWDAGLRVIDVSDPTAPTEVGAYNTSGYACGVAVSGSYAYVADYGAGLVVLDITTPASPTLAGSEDTPGYAWDVVLDGDYAYVADGFGGLQIVDVTVPASPTTVASCSASNTIKGVAVLGNYAYVADGTSGLRVIDITDPTAPKCSYGSFDTPGSAMDVIVEGIVAYVADGSAGLQALDVTDPSNPVALGCHDTPGTAYAVAVSGDAAYVADAGGGLRVVDVSSVPAPGVVGQAEVEGSAEAVAVDGWTAYVAAASGGLRAFDVSDPTDPVELAWSCADMGQAVDVALQGDYAYVADWAGKLRIADVASPSAPVCSVGAVDVTGSPSGVAVSGTMAYVAHGGTGLTGVDVSTPGSPSVDFTLNTPGSANDVAVSGSYAYVADGASGLQVLDIITPAGPVGSLAISGGYAWGLDYADDIAYVAAGDAGLWLIDVSTPASPTKLSSFDTSAFGSAHSVAVHNDYAYVVVGGLGVIVIGVSDPDNLPSEVTAWCGTPSGPGPSDLAVQGGYAYVADAEAGLAVIDLLPAYTELAAFDTPALAQRLAVVEGTGDTGLAYLACGKNGLKVVEVSDTELPDDPVQVGVNRNLTNATDVAVEDGYALYATNSTYGMSVLAEADPTKPYKLGSTATSGSALGVDNATILGVKYALVADGGEGLSVISTQRRSQPEQKGALDTPGWASDVAAITLDGKNYACIADGGSGLRIVNLSPERAMDSTIFSDDFEDEFAGWQQTGTVEWYTLEPKNGTHAVRLRTDASIQQGISTLGFEDITVSFSLGVSGLDTGSEYVLAQWYDGQDWNSLTEIRAGDQLEDRLYQFASSLGADADDNPDFILRFEIHCSGPADSAYVDDVLVKGDAVYEPYEVGFYNTPGQARGVAVAEDRAYVADGDAGVRLVDISRPAHLVELGYYDTVGWAESVAAVGNLALVADGDSGLILVDFSTPSAPAQVAYYQTPGWAADVGILGDCAYVADTGWGLDILALWHSFQDVPFYHWAYPRIEAAVSNGITVGYPDGLFHPEFNVSRDQMAVFMARAHYGGDPPEYTGYRHFEDVPASHWAYDHVEYCYSQDIVRGYADDLYHPAVIVTRDQMAVFMARARGWVTIDEDLSTAPELFDDIPAGFWAGKAIQACVNNGVVRGYPDGYYRPTWKVSRDQMAVFIAQAFGL